MMSGKDCWNKNVLRCRRNECSDWADVTSLGRLFHTQPGKLRCRQMTVWGMGVSTSWQVHIYFGDWWTVILPYFHGTCMQKLLFLNFRLKFWHRHQTPRPRIPKNEQQFGDQTTFSGILITWEIKTSAIFLFPVYLTKRLWTRVTSSHVALRTRIIFTEFELESCNTFQTYNVLTANTLRHTVTLTFHPSLFNFCSASTVTRSNSVSK